MKAPCPMCGYLKGHGRSGEVALKRHLWTAHNKGPSLSCAPIPIREQSEILDYIDPETRNPANQEA